MYIFYRSRFRRHLFIFLYSPPISYVIFRSYVVHSRTREAKTLDTYDFIDAIALIAQRSLENVD